MQTVSLFSDQQQYTVYDINDCVIITTTNRRIALRYFDLAQQYGTVLRVWAVDQFLATQQRALRRGPAVRG